MDARRAAATIARRGRVVSVASVWEFEIEAASGGRPGDFDFLEKLAALRGELLSIEAEDAVAAARSPPHHGDPFDRMTIAEARRPDLTIVTHDRAVERHADTVGLTARHPVRSIASSSVSPELACVSNRRR